VTWQYLLVFYLPITMMLFQKQQGSFIFPFSAPPARSCVKKIVLLLEPRSNFGCPDCAGTLHLKSQPVPRPADAEFFFHSTGAGRDKMREITPTLPHFPERRGFSKEPRVISVVQTPLFLVFPILRLPPQDERSHVKRAIPS